MLPVIANVALYYTASIFFFDKSLCCNLNYVLCHRNQSEVSHMIQQNFP